ncbi:MAG: DNA mismatch repair endonuclease MutL [Planctomycetes bacterium]|nr:DNA mismatch repair endonuclease MutL [Planctomycetota bacterium]
MPIRRLSQHLVNQIAAGEVIERPASVVKELVENALDAGATQIEVRIEGGGRERIEVSDNGGGISAEDLLLAVSPHATSKISTAEDLAGIGSFGFRGEALASVGSVSRLVVVSRPASSGSGGQGASIEVDFGQFAPVRPAASPVGTRVEVHQLFGQVPARRKFLRSDPTEAGKVVDVLEWLALGRPQVSFRLYQHDRMTLELPAVEDPQLRVEAVLGDEFAGKLIPVDLSGAGAVAIWGLIGRPDQAKASANGLRITLNGRPISDRGLMHAMREAYRGLVEPGRTPVGFIAIDIDPREVDVNVHPAKSEVRFRQPALIHSALLRAVRSALQGANLVPSLPLGGSSFGAPWRTSSGSGAHQGASPRSAEDSWQNASFTPHGGERGFEFASLRDALGMGGASGAGASSSGAALAENPAAGGTMHEPGLLAAPRPATRFLQAGKAWLLTFDADGIVVVDQHALHERVMFEQLRSKLTAGSLPSQPRLVPRMIALDAAQLERLEASQELLQRLGFDVRAAGPKSAALFAEPLFLVERKVDVAELILGWLSRDRASTEDGEAVLSEVLDMMSCKAAVKAGDALSDVEIASLLQDLERVERSTNCPHGRPTAMRIPYRELERRFGRG